MSKYSRRLVIYAKDVANITGRKNRTCYELLRKIKEFFNKQAYAPVTIFEFAHFMNIDVEVVKAGLVD